MGSERDVRSSWADIVAAEQHLARCSADFYQDADSRAGVLVAALAGSNWDRQAALNFLRRFPEDVPALLELLVEHALSHRWASLARSAIRSGRRDSVAARLPDVIDRYSAGAEGDDYRRLAELCAEVEHWDILGRLVRQTMASDDVEIREVGEDFLRKYGPMLAQYGSP